jgi:hypothetical protein
MRLAALISLSALLLAQGCTPVASPTPEPMTGQPQQMAPQTAPQMGGDIGSNGPSDSDGAGGGDGTDDWG